MDHSLFDAQPYLTRKETAWVIGLVLSGIAYGSLLTLGITCLAALYRSPPTFRYKLFFSSYVVAVLFINTFLQIWNAESTITAIFYTDPDRITFFYHGWENVFLVVLLILTDGILVWRCYMVQKVLPFGESVSVWDDICLVPPTLLWVSETVTGIVAVALLKPAQLLLDEAEATSPGLTYFLITVIAHVTLNIFATSNIIIRLLRHRRSLIVVFGRENASAARFLQTSNILIQSAAINIPLGLFAIVVSLTPVEIGPLLTQVLAPGQCIASVLVIYQVAVEKAHSDPSTKGITSQTESIEVLDIQQGCP